jgi:branched-chain amino acid transport system substrate-binding protein
MKKIYTLLVVLLAIAGLAVSSCKRATDNAIHFGAILSLTGAAAPYGQDNLHGLQLAQEVLNERGGIRGKKVEVDIQDSTGDAAQAVTLAQRFASDSNVLGILGPTRTGETVAVAKLLPNLQIPMMSVGSTGDWKTAGGDFNDWTFRSTRVDTYLIEPLLKAAHDRFGVRKVAIIYTANDDYAKSVEPMYETVAQNLGIELVAKESQMTGDTDRSAQLTKIKTAQPDALIINTLASDAPTIADQARKLGITARFLGTAGFTNPSTWQNAGPGVLEGTIVAENFFPGSSKPAVQQFVERYKKKFGGDPPPYAAYAYDGLMLLAEAISKTKDPNDRRSIRDALGALSGYEGVLGTLTYHGKGDADKTPIILQIQQGKYVQLS